MRLFIFMTVFTLALTAFAQTAQAAQAACPLGAKDDHLTLQRVMINFEKFTMAADSVVQKYQTPDIVTDAQVIQAVQDLQIVDACADAVLHATSDELLPSGARKLTGAAREQYAAEFLQAMTALRSAIQDYAAALINSNTGGAGTAGQPRDLTTALAKKKIVDEIADQAHSHF